MCRTRRRIFSGSGIRRTPGAYLSSPSSGSSSWMAPGEGIASTPSPRVVVSHNPVNTIPGKTIQVTVRKGMPLLLLFGRPLVCCLDVPIDLRIPRELIGHFRAHIVDAIRDPTTIAGQIEVVI